MKSLSEICCERNPTASDHRRRILASLKRGADIGETDKNGVTPLHHAVRFRNPAAVEVLIENGADVNHRCKRSESTPLHRAVTSTGAPGTAGKQTEREQIIRLLLEAGADPAIKNRKGKSPRDYATDDVVRTLLE